ncbi:hypothetical protein DVS28_a5015 [Euzebya pacifica]|uniref:Uncharacterized protein n=1 Tax=Euzebya pacifica TaxID=1608957 RepID=A0A346Y5C5_9ACTN|nr:hypothetical protein DVS28_a5015 [Euzebya pacifica]
MVTMGEQLPVGKYTPRGASHSCREPIHDEEHPMATRTVAQQRAEAKQAYDTTARG